MRSTRSRSVFNDFIKSVNDHPWFYGWMLFLTFIGAVAAANVVNGIPIEVITDLYEQKDGFVDGLSSDMLSNVAYGYGLSEEEKGVCTQFNYNLRMCNAIHEALCSPDSDSYSGVTENKATYFCNLVDVGNKVLSKEILERCARIFEDSAYKFGVGY